MGNLKDLGTDVLNSWRSDWACDANSEWEEEEEEENSEWEGGGGGGGGGDDKKDFAILPWRDTGIIITPLQGIPQQLYEEQDLPTCIVKVNSKVLGVGANA